MLLPWTNNQEELRGESQSFFVAYARAAALLLCASSLLPFLFKQLHGKSSFRRLRDYYYHKCSSGSNFRCRLSIHFCSVLWWVCGALRDGGQRRQLHCYLLQRRHVRLHNSVFFCKLNSSLLSNVSLFALIISNRFSPALFLSLAVLFCHELARYLLGFLCSPSARNKSTRAALKPNSPSQRCASVLLLLIFFLFIFKTTPASCEP